MNFLGHSMISLEIDEKIDRNKKTLYGNFAGDFYKGKIERINLPDNLKEGLVLHRIIDGISDRNENFLNKLLTQKFGLFRGYSGYNWRYHMSRFMKVPLRPDESFASNRKISSYTFQRVFAFAYKLIFKGEKNEQFPRL